ncbi:Ppx/GppA family phosphatase [Altererythrobacter xixiisoli]|uniref:Ppx/GppA family phosphatase n=1 Tax=Croceibacterium xixiisoli TaxID=1476466 RepID=A0A6I4TWH7_9SPHN|nr:Ppx/GppA family phosphatase [Croceibacterium xixiisoli]MXP00397.1 Ppx/GppA family phosphatase [Croceibacterium xixiisoli]
MIASNAARRRPPVSDQPDRAVIDIGSNTVRLVVYSGPPRAPNVWLNEKVSARLGRDLSQTGRMPDKAMDLALSALGRYAALLPDLEVRNVDTVATAAVRDAANGPEFLERVVQLGLSPRLLSGEEEALTSATGVIGAFPGALGTVADLGGGSLELVQVENGELHGAASLQLGTLRLPKLREAGLPAFRKAVAEDLHRVGWANAHPGPLYMVGGTWRALAAFAMRRDSHPVTDPHGFRLSCEDADAAAKQIMRMTPAQLAPIPGISSSRAVGLPDAAAMLRVMLARLKPDGLVFSSWGLREGVLFDRLSPGAKEQDPLIAAVSHFVAPRGGSATLAATIAAWTAPVAGGSGNGSERLRLTATMFALAAAQVEPNHRARHAYEWAMEKRWLTLSPADRARIAAALLASCGRSELPPELARIASPEQLREAVGWGLAIRLCRRLGAGSRVSLSSSALRRDENRLILRVDPVRAALVSDLVRNDCKALGQWLGLQHEIVFAEAATG